jgi:hypothetical protein
MICLQNRRTHLLVWSSVFSARCVGAASPVTATLSRPCPAHLGLAQGELVCGVMLREPATDLPATQSLQLPSGDALPRQRRHVRKRNFALDLPLVA